MTESHAEACSQETAFAANQAYGPAQSKMSFLPNYYRWTYRRIRPYLKGVVAELGCGAGNGIAGHLTQVSRLVAVDHDPHLLETLSKRFDSAKVEPVLMDLNEDWSGLSGQFDAIVMMDLLEHFEDDLLLLEKALARLKKNGVLALKVPAQAAWFSDMDIASGHFRRYDRPDIERLADRCGLRLLEIERINVVGGLLYNFKKRRRVGTNFSRSFSDRQLRLANRAIPLIALADLIPRMPGLSWVAVLGRA